MASYDKGKKEAVEFIKKTFGQGSTCLDVGACDGKWYDLVGDYLTMDAIEIFEPYVVKNNLRRKYNSVLIGDIIKAEYQYYDLIIFGDVLEHMSVEDSQKVLEYAKPRCKDLIIAVPFELKQGAINGNRNEIHIQDDLTPEVFNERYGEYEEIWSDDKYAYYHKKPPESPITKANLNAKKKSKNSPKTDKKENQKSSEKVSQKTLKTSTNKKAV